METIVVVGGIALLVFLARKTKPETEPKTEPPPTPREDSPPTPPRIPNDGKHPRREPKQGHWYQVREGDILIRIMRRAGLPDRANLFATSHPENAWIPKYRQQNGTNTLRLYPRFRPAYKGGYLDRSVGQFPVIYIPTIEEYRRSRWYK